MATIVRSGNFFEITSIGADLTAKEIFRKDGAIQEVKVKRMEFVCGSNNDVCVIKQASGSGATIATLSSADVEVVDRVYFDDDGQWMIPFVDFGDCTLNVGHKLVIEVA